MYCSCAACIVHLIYVITHRHKNHVQESLSYHKVGLHVTVCTYVMMDCGYTGFYTEWLIYAAFVGFVVMLYGYSTIPTHRNALA